MRIGIVIIRIGSEDGVAVETEKWIDVLHRMGHEVFILSGEFDKDVVAPEHQREEPLISHFSKENQWIQNEAFLNPSGYEKKLLNRIDRDSHAITNIIRSWIEENALDVLISENASALPFHLTLGIALRNAVEDSGISCISHDHDYYWERGKRYSSPYESVNERIRSCFPLRNTNTAVKHVVINSIAQEQLREHYDLDATLVPNVMDFDSPFGEKTEYNADLPSQLGLSDTDTPLFQVTRVVERKGIETAIDLLAHIPNESVKLVITGRSHDDHTNEYERFLQRYAEHLNVRDRIIFAEGMFDYSFPIRTKEMHQNGVKKTYALSDAYAHAVACTYFSIYEGFGNNFLEAVAAKKPVFVRNYPVFEKDIKTKGFKTVTVTNGDLDAENVLEIKRVLSDPSYAQEITEHNFALGKKYYSYEILESHLTRLLKSLSSADTSL